MSMHYIKVLTLPSFSIDSDFKVTWWIEICCVHWQLHSPPVHQVAKKIVNSNFIQKTPMHSVKTVLNKLCPHTYNDCKQL